MLKKSLIKENTHKKKRKYSSNTFLSLSLACTQPEYFVALWLMETGFSAGFSSGRGSHLLFIRLLGLLFNFSNEEIGVKLCILLHYKIYNMDQLENTPESQ